MMLRPRKRRPRQGGFTLLEIVVVIAIIGTLIAVALQRLLPWLDEAERVSVLTMEAQIQSSLVMEGAKRIARGEFTTLTDLEGVNPIRLMLAPPKNYAGELEAQKAAESPVRHWHFNLGNRRLVYRMGPAYALDRKNQQKVDPEYEVRVAFADNNGTGVFEPRDDELYGVRLQRIAGSGWLDSGKRY